MIAEEQIPLQKRKLILIARMDPQFCQETLLPRATQSIARNRDRIESVPTWKAAVDQFLRYWNAENCIMLMHHYAYADIPCGKHYDVFGEVNDQWHIMEETVLSCPSVALSFLLKFKELPFETADHGVSALCLMQFPSGIPHLIDQLEILDGTKQIRGKRKLFVSTRETMQADLKEQKAALYKFTD